MLDIGLDRLIEEARAELNAGIRAFNGSNEIARAYYRMLVSLRVAIELGVVDMILCLTDEDFDLLCECQGIDPAEARKMDCQLIDCVPVRPGAPASAFIGFDAAGRDAGSPVVDDAIIAHSY